MAAPYYDIEAKLEEALASVVTNLAIANLQVRTGADDEDLGDSIRCICVAGQGVEIMQTGTFRFESASIKASSPWVSEASLDDHRDLVAQIRDAFTATDIAETLSDAVIEFTVYDPIGGIQLNTSTEQRSFVSEMTLDITAVAADV